MPSGNGILSDMCEGARQQRLSGIFFFKQLKRIIMEELLVKMAKENGWRVCKQGKVIVLSKGRSTIECPDGRSAIEYLQTNNI